MSLITPDDLTLYKNYFDAIITEWGKPCKIWYPPLYTPCTNCNPDITGNVSSNTYLHGGPIPFQDGQICPMCNGSYLHAVESTSSITMFIYFKVSDFKKLGSNIVVPEGGIVTKCFITDVPNIKNCIKMQVQTSISPYGQFFYKLNSDGGDLHNIIQGRYFHHIWERLS